MGEIIAKIISGVLIALILAFLAALLLWIVYRQIAVAYSLPELSYWVFFGVVFAIKLLAANIRISENE